MTDPNFDGAFSGEIPRQPDTTDHFVLEQFEPSPSSDTSLITNPSIEHADSIHDEIPFDGGAIEAAVAQTNILSQDTALNQEQDPLRAKRMTAFAKKFVEFSIFKYTAVAEFVGAIFGADALHENTGTNKWLLSAATVLLVSGIEYPQSRMAARRRERVDYSKRNVREGIHSFPVEASVLLSSAWNGAGSTVIPNEDVGIETTKARSRFQSLTYGMAVALWTSPIPGVSWLSDKGTDATKKYVIDELVQNPVVTIAKGLLASTLVVGVFETIKHTRNKRKLEKVEIANK